MEILLFKYYKTLLRPREPFRMKQIPNFEGKNRLSSREPQLNITFESDDRMKNNIFKFEEYVSKEELPKTDRDFELLDKNNYRKLSSNNTFKTSKESSVQE